ncbi:unnamed protein product [Closterium sp. Yama58-4]|nr:unnamed protein product [Closterium sp. Yama58-4]
MLLTRAGFDIFFRHCTRLEHLSLGCLHRDFRLPNSIYQLVRLRSLHQTTIWDYQDLQNLTQLASLTCLSVPREVFSSSRAPTPHPFSFAHLSSLKSLDLGYGCPRFDVMFPSDSPCTLLERLALNQCNDLANLPDDISDRLPSLRELSISDCFMKHPEQVVSLSRLRSLILSSCSFTGLPDSFGEMPVLKTLVLDKLSLSFPASCSLLQSLETLVVTECTHSDELRGPLSFPTSLKTLCLAGSPFLVLPDDIGELLNLETLFLKMYHDCHQLPSSFTLLPSLTRLELQQCELAEVPEAMGSLRRLRELYILSCWRIQKLPESVSALGSLEILVVDKCSGFFSLPKNLMNLTRLKQLELTGSLFLLEELHLVLACEEEFPFPLADLPHLRILTVVSTGFFKLPDFSRSTLQELRRLEISLPELMEIPATIAALQKLTCLGITAPKLPSLPDSIGALSRLCELTLSKCRALTHLPASLTQLSHLRKLQLSKTSITSLPPNFARLSQLQVLDLRKCMQLEALPDDLGELKLLDSLNTDGCDKLHDDQGSPAWGGTTLPAVYSSSSG